MSSFGTLHIHTVRYKEKHIIIFTRNIPVGVTWKCI